MGNVEVAYELRNAADWLLASPAETPYDGSYYSESLAPLYGELPSGLSDCARTTYDYYAGQTTASKRSLTLSVYRMSAIEPLADAVADIYAASAPLSSVNGLQQYGFAARWAYFPNNFFDIDNYLTARTSSTALTSQLSDALNDFVYAHYATPMMWNQYPLTHVSGLSVFPYDELSSTGDRYSYTELAWYKRVYR
jgi:hypothetical protein